MAAMSNDKIAILCAVGEGGEISAGHTQDVASLIADGFIEPMPKAGAEKYQLTPHGQQFISERGAGLNEA